MKVLHPDTLAQIKDDHLRAMLVKLDFSPQPIYLCNTAFDIQYNGNTYLGNGQLLALGKLKQDIDIKVSNVDLTLDAADPSLVAMLLGISQHGRDVDILLVILDKNYAIAGEPIPMGSMIINGAPSLTDDPINEKAIIKQKISSEFANWKQKGGMRTTPSSLKRFSAGDTGFDFAAEAGKEYKWGGK